MLFHIFSSIFFRYNYYIYENRKTQATILKRAQQLNCYAMGRWNNMRVHESILAATKCEKE